MFEQASNDGWVRVAFGDVVGLSRERSSDPEADGFQRYVGLDHIEPGELRLRRWGNLSEGTTFTTVFRPGQVLFGKRRAYQRKVAVADFEGVCSGDIYVLEAKREFLLPELLPFICQTEGFFEHAVGTSAGSLSPRTKWENLATYRFALPPLDEQRRIATALLAINTARQSLAETQQRLMNVRRSHLDSFFEPRLTDGVPLAEVARVIAGGTPSKANPALWNGGRPWASGKDLKVRGLSETAETLSDEGWALATIAPRGATLIVVRGMILAHTFPVTRCERDIAFNQDLRALVARDQLEPAYLFLWVEWAAPWFLARTAASSHGTKRLEGHIFDQALVPVPSKPEQMRFVEQHETFVHAETVLELRMERLLALRKSFSRAELERRP